MTPKEKAKEIRNKMYEATPTRYSLELLYSDKEIAKQCALIAVDEIIKDKANTTINEHLLNGALAYWSEVKNEIEKL